MKLISIEETLRAYYQVTGINQDYTIVAVNQIPSEVIDVRSVCINGAYVKFYEHCDLEYSRSTIYWMLEGMKN